ncbi:hypothetical protein BH20CHL6_BH20CHL6_09360 [soil metagenome]
MKGPESKPLSDIRLLLIDGNNLLHRLQGSIAPAALRTLIARLNGALPPSTHTILMLDGPPDPGAPSRQKIRQGLELQHAGRIDADGAIVFLVADRPFGERADTVVVTDDRALSERVRRVGGRTRRLSWLEGLLDEPGAGGHGSGSGSGSGSGGSSRSGARPVGVGHPKPPLPQSRDRADGDDDGDEADRQGWQPGRGATRKRGNPRRGRPMDHGKELR